MMNKSYNGIIFQSLLNYILVSHGLFDYVFETWIDPVVIDGYKLRSRRGNFD
uniref:Uncharacterized protein n=1 Tax=Tetranychus urticae TaxID=32264 RepID=T1JRR2_TETUR